MSSYPYRNPIIKIRWSHDSFILIIELPIFKIQLLYIESTGVKLVKTIGSLKIFCWLTWVHRMWGMCLFRHWSSIWPTHSGSSLCYSARRDKPSMPDYPSQTKSNICHNFPPDLKMNNDHKMYVKHIKHTYIYGPEWGIQELTEFLIWQK